MNLSTIIDKQNLFKADTHVSPSVLFTKKHNFIQSVRTTIIDAFSDSVLGDQATRNA